LTSPLSARFGYAGNLPGDRQLPETDPAQIELSHIAARTSASEAAVPHASRKLRRQSFGCRLSPTPLHLSVIPTACARRHSIPFRFLPERHAEILQQRHGFGVRLRRRSNTDVHSLGFFHFVVVDFRKNQLVLQTQGVIAPAVKTFVRNTAEVAHARQS